MFKPYVEVSRRERFYPSKDQHKLHKYPIEFHGQNYIIELDYTHSVYRKISWRKCFDDVDTAEEFASKVTMRYKELKARVLQIQVLANF